MVGFFLRRAAAEALAAAARRAASASASASSAPASSASTASTTTAQSRPLAAALRKIIGGPHVATGSQEQQQQQQQRHHHNNAPPRPPPLARRSFSSSSSSSWAAASGGSDPGDRGRPPPNVTDAQFTSEQDQQQQRAHRAAALRSSMDALVDAAVGAVERGALPSAVEVLERGLGVLEAEHGEAPELGELHNQAALLLLLQSTGGGEDEEAAAAAGGGSGGGGGGNSAAAPLPPLERAAEHATQALRLTERAFGATHPLTGHRLLRLGTIRLAQGRPADAAPLLAAAADMLGTGGSGGSGGSGKEVAFGPGLAEARFHLALLPVGAARQASAVAAAEDALASSLAELVSLLGPDSMIVRLALAQHSAAVGRGLETAAALAGGAAAAAAGGGGGGGAGGGGGIGSGSAASLALSEALLKQHARLQERRDRGSAELGLARYQLAVLYYANDLLHDAQASLRAAREALSAHVPAGHDVDRLMSHRAGMIAAAQGDARAAERLLAASAEHYAAQAREMVGGGGGGGGEGGGASASSSPPPLHPLQREAEFGLALARLRALEQDPRVPREEREARAAALLDEAAAARRDVARALGASHLLSLGAARYEAQARVMLRKAGKK